MVEEEEDREEDGEGAILNPMLNSAPHPHPPPLLRPGDPTLGVSGERGLWKEEDREFKNSSA